ASSRRSPVSNGRPSARSPSAGRRPSAATSTCARAAASNDPRTTRVAIGTVRSARASRKPVGSSSAWRASSTSTTSTSSSPCRRRSDRWRPARQRHLFPVRVLGALFRGKVLSALQRSLARGELASADPVTTRRTLGALHHAPWLVYVKRPFGGAKRLFQYLGRYTHRVGLSNHRLVTVTPDAVTFRTKDGRTATLHPEEFLRRLLLHVLPSGFVKIRHSGLFASRQASTALPIAHCLLADRPPAVPSAAPSPWPSVLQRLTGIDVTRCPRCDRS